MGWERLQRALGVRFRDTGLLVEAMTHPSYVHETPTAGTPDNQRLEFLGDAIVSFVAADWLFRRYPYAREGDLTALRAHLVRTESLAALGEGLMFGEHLRVGRGEASSGGKTRAANLCAAFEAVVGAVYIDQGLAAVTAWLEPLLAQRLGGADATLPRDPKSLLQEYSQAELHVTPVYEIVDEEGPDHARWFTAQVLLGEQVSGEGSGSSKQAAQRAAAQDALDRLLPGWRG